VTDHPSNLGDSPEHIAYRLFEMIVAKDPPKPPITVNATWILSTYARCLRVVRNPDSLKPAETGRPKVP